ncbi:SDR family NAD(P)-dependent oxidoreductase [Xanthocytophaga flava]|nr:SDR family NAD(P)-dependent oxidoreductase [Xanthocytophaga flavus]
MNKTVLITGTSSGFGASAANYFAQKGWNVIATMGDTGKASGLRNLENIFVTKLNVEDIASIQWAIEAGIKHLGKIDVLVNNAGYGLFGIFESASRQAIQNQFAVNVFGAMDVTRAILPHFRENKSGVIINVNSGAGAIGFPMASIYSASKFALEG